MDLKHTRLRDPGSAAQVRQLFVHGEPATISDDQGEVLITVSRHVEPPASAAAGADALTVVTVDGDIDIDTAPLVRAALIQELHAGDVCCDLSGVPFLAAAGAQALFAAHEYASDQGHAFACRGAGGLTARALAVVDPDRIIMRRSQPEDPTSSSAADGLTGSLHDRLIALAGTPDHSDEIEAVLTAITRFAATRIPAVEYASVTSRREGAYATVAVSDGPAMAVDQAQYADDAGPCLDALDGGVPMAVPDIAATVTWPAFRDTAARLGLTTSLSIPMFAGSGRPVAALNLYGHDPAAMKALAAAVWDIYDPAAEAPSVSTAGLDPGSRELTAGLSGALAVRNLIQQALGIITGTAGPGAAYLALCAESAERGTPLPDTAARLIARHHRKS